MVRGFYNLSCGIIDSQCLVKKSGVEMCNSKPPYGSPRRSGAPAARTRPTEARKLFPDLKHEILDMVAEGDRVAARYKVTATHQRKFKDFTPTGNKVVINAAAVYRIANGKITEEWGFVNPSDLDNQLKAIN